MHRVADEDVTWPHLVTLRQGHSRCTLVFVPGQLGYPLFYRSLALTFSGNERVLALQLPGVHEDEPLAEHSIEEMAELFEPQVLGACPEGPILLGGYSMGALLSLELAARLIKRGRHVPAIISLDGYAPRYPQVGGTCHRLLAHWQDFKANPGFYLRERRTNLQRRALALLDEDWRLAPGVTLSDDAAASRSAPSDARAEIGHFDFDARQYERNRRFAVLRRRAAFRYDPNCKVRSSLLLVRAQEPEFQVGAKVESTYGWTPYVEGRIQDLCLPGTHRQLLESVSNRRAIAQAISGHMRATPELQGANVSISSETSQLTRLASE